MKSSWKCIQYPHDCYRTRFISAADLHAKYVRSKVGPIASFSLSTLEIAYRSSGKSLKKPVFNLSVRVKRELYIFKTLPPLPESGGMGYDTKTEEIFLAFSSI